LILVTKGDPPEQSRKVERSGLKEYFSEVEIVAEKHTAAYSEITERHGLSTEHTWMIGNSPKSDINPALGARINAVFVPHDETWILEHEELATPQPPSRLLVLGGFSELTRYF
jgi:putative hydrolase of the HAD superfamily